MNLPVITPHIKFESEKDRSKERKYFQQASCATGNNQLDQKNINLVDIAAPNKLPIA